MLENIARNVDRLVTTGAPWGRREDRWKIPSLYDVVYSKLGRSPSLAAAQKFTEIIKPRDVVFIVTGFATWPRQPLGETDGPLGAASLARALRLGLGALPMLICGPKDMGGMRATAQAAGMNTMEYEMAKVTNTTVAAYFTFPFAGKEESRKIAIDLLDKYKPKAVISVETSGPNKKGIKHSAAGYDGEAIEKMPGVEYLFLEATPRKIFTVGCIDHGNELGAGTIEEDVRRISPYADVCRCPCKAGTACSVKTDIVVPAFVSNWGAYAMSTMMAILLKKLDIFQNAEMEHRMLEACVMAGATDGPTGRLDLLVDGHTYQANEGLVSFLNCIILNGLMEKTIDSFSR